MCGIACSLLITRMETQTARTAKTKNRKFETNIPRKGTARIQSQFLHPCFCDRLIFSSYRSAYSAAEKYVCQTWEYINRSQKHECGNWDWGRAIPFLGIHKSKFLGSVCNNIEITKSKLGQGLVASQAGVPDVVLKHEEQVEADGEDAKAQLGQVPRNGGPVARVHGNDQHLGNA